MKRVIRTGIIEINSAKPNDKQWVSAKIQRYELDNDNNYTSESAREERMYRRIDRVAMETVDYVNPLTGETKTIAVAELGVAIKNFMSKWMLEDYDATYDPELDVVVLNDPTS